MLNRRYTEFPEVKVTDNASSPSPGIGKGPGNKDGYVEKTRNWPGAPGPGGPNRNKVGFKKVKQSAKTTI